MKLLAYWPFGIAVAWSGTLILSLGRYGAPPAIRALLLLGVVLVVAVAAANARWVERHRRAVYLTPELLARISAGTLRAAMKGRQ